MASAECSEVGRNQFRSGRRDSLVDERCCGRNKTGWPVTVRTPSEKRRRPICDTFDTCVSDTLVPIPVVDTVDFSGGIWVKSFGFGIRLYLTKLGEHLNAILQHHHRVGKYYFEPLIQTMLLRNALVVNTSQQQTKQCFTFYVGFVLKMCRLLESYGRIKSRYLFITTVPFRTEALRNIPHL